MTPVLNSEFLPVHARTLTRTLQDEQAHFVLLSILYDSSRLLPLAAWVSDPSGILNNDLHKQIRPYGPVVRRRVVMESSRSLWSRGESSWPEDDCATL